MGGCGRAPKARQASQQLLVGWQEGGGRGQQATGGAEVAAGRVVVHQLQPGLKGEWAGGGWVVGAGWSNGGPEQPAGGG